MNYCKFIGLLIVFLLISEKGLTQVTFTDSLLTQQIDSLMEVYVRNETYDEAYEIAQEYVEHESFENAPRFWHHYGLACTGFMANMRGLYEEDPTAAFKADSAFVRAKTLYESPQMKDSLEKCRQNLHSIIINRISADYKQIKDGEVKDSTTYLSLLDYALEASKFAEKINPKDTLNYFYSTKFSMLKGNYQRYEEDKFKWIRLIKDLPNKRLAYADMLSVYQDKIQSDSITLVLLDKILIDFPEDKEFISYKLELSEKLRNKNKAIEAAKARINADPSNPRNYFNLGLVYQKMNEPEKAIEAYLKCLKINPGDYNALFFMGKLYFNNGVKVLQSIKNLTYTEYHKQEKAIEQKAKNEFEQARHYFEKLEQTAPNDKKVLEALKRTYSFLKLEDKVAEINQKMAE